MPTRAAILSFLLLILSVPLVAGATATATAGPTAADKGSTGSSGKVGGTVEDTSGAVLAGAKIVLEPGATTAVSNAQGDFLISNVKPGDYTVTITYVGFRDIVSKITVKPGQTTPLDAKLTVGSASQQVVVTADLDGDTAEINEQRTSE